MRLLGLSQIFDRFLPFGTLPPATDLPLRSEIFSTEQLQKLASELAAGSELATRQQPDNLLSRLEDNHRLLIDARDRISAAIGRGRRITPAAEWLLDNFYLIEEQVRIARRHLPPSYSRELPRPAKGPTARYPRVYGIVLELVSHIDGRLDAASLNAFFAAYQTVTPLKLGELWAIPIMLRLALIENLRRVAAHIAMGRQDRDLADDWADRILSVVEKRPGELILVLADLARTRPSLSGPFLAEFTRRLQGQSAHVALATAWIEQRLAEQGLTIERLVHADGQSQASAQVSVGNSITSLRFLKSIDWRDFVEGQSVVEKILRTDPAGTYSDMDFATRDRYRHAVEQIARHGLLSEMEVAGHAVALATAAVPARSDFRSGHVGYHLVDRGRSKLEQIASVRRPFRAAIDAAMHRHALPVYFATILLSTLLLSVAVLTWLAGHVELTAICIGALPVVLCASQIGVGLANWHVTRLVKPRPLPRMNFSRGIPAEHQALVAIPTMLSSAGGITQLMDDLEIRYLSNRDRHLRFALITDFQDAAEGVTPADAELVRLAREGIEQLNVKYHLDRPNIFFLFHRPRLWSEPDRVWMGHERKRGKLMALNAALRGSGGDFSEIVGDQSVLSAIRYVITLDTDTKLPRDAACVMVGTMAHPLNHPIFDASRGRVVDGYGILQPRVGASLSSSQTSWYSRLFSGDVGVDPYTRVVSDVYQDLFGEGSFIGKGIYNVDIFQLACRTLPTNSILSHDLLEGAYARSGLLSDVELYEDYPSRYSSDVSRRRRWTRGDWQLLPWLFPKVPALGQPRIGNPISLLSWWKIFDNLRRSLVPVAMSLLLLGSLLVPETSVGMAMALLILATVLATPLLDAVVGFGRTSPDVSLGLSLRLTASSLFDHLVQGLLTVTFLAHDAWNSAVSIVRSLVRVLWTKRKLLQWKTSDEAERSDRLTIAGDFRSMWIGPFLAAAVLLASVVVARPVNWPVGVVLVLWALSPVVAWWLSRPIVVLPDQLSAEHRRYLRQLSRKTWRFFEVFVTADDNFLPPDNVQENRSPVVASRTSPTNIGMALLANLAAYDFGYSSVGQLLDRTAKTFVTLGKLERHRRHFFNWYDTRTLRPLLPKYVSSVDSGNLAGHLLVLRSGLLELIDAPIAPPKVFDGLRDTLSLLLDGARQSVVPLPAEAIRRIENLERRSMEIPASATESIAMLEQFLGAAAEFRSLLSTDPEFQWWAASLERACTDHRNDLLQLLALARLPIAAEESWPPSLSDELANLRGCLVRLNQAGTLREVAAFSASAVPLIDAILAGGSPLPSLGWLAQLRGHILASADHASARIQSIRELAEQCADFADMDFTFLLDDRSNLFSVGFNVSDGRRDDSFYDLLASEARLASFVLIAQGQAGLDHWFALGRLLTASDGDPVLLSWSGSMFEYLMPLLVMPTYDRTLLDQTCKAVVHRQIEYGKQRGVPWGISESGYNAMDGHQNYQYRAFGVPGLGLKRGLAEDLVVAPYATVMALMVNLDAACQNLDRLVAAGMGGPFGLYEAIDYTPSRLPPGNSHVVVREFMVHHQGMSFLSLAYVLLDKPMQRRFNADPLLRAADLLLQERIPKISTPIFPHSTEANANRAVPSEDRGTMRIINDPGTGLVPETHLLSNGRYHVAITAAGGGYSRLGDTAITRWREDATRDCHGMFLYLRDRDSGQYWSNAYQPTHKSSKSYEAVFTQSRAEFRRRDYEIETHTEISVSPEDDVELRRLTITNRSSKPRTIEVTSYAEVVLAGQAQDLAHPAFSNLFVQTELVRDRQAILCTRRPRSANETPPWMVHLMTITRTTPGSESDEVSFETDRMKFIGRTRSLAAPAAMQGPLTDSAGPVLDPIVSIRRVVRLEPDESVQVDLITGVGPSRDVVSAMMDKYHDSRLADRAFELAWTHSQVLLRQLNATETDARAYGRLAGSILCASSVHRASSTILARNKRGQSGLWGYGISGDLPIILVRIRNTATIELVRQVVQAHAYWRLKGLAVDLVIWNEDDSGYRQALQDRITDLVAASTEAHLIDKPGGIFVRRGEQMSEEDRVLLQTVSRVILHGDSGTFAEQVERKGRVEIPVPAFKPRRRLPELLPHSTPAKRDLAFFNGHGGFSQDGREYVTFIFPGHPTPAPWINVLANPEFGAIVSESGGGYTWSENCHELRLTPWHNDPVSDTTGEAFYLRDEETGRFWSPTALPAPGINPYVCRHGFGYTIFEYTEDGITTELCVFVATDAPVKFARLRIFNRSGRPRQLTATGYWEWVLGELRNKSLLHITTELDPVSGAFFTRNPYNADFPGRIAFVDCSEPSRSVTTDRTEFIGRNGSLANPAALRRARLSGRVAAGLDPCTAVQVPFSLEDGENEEIVFILGAARNEDHARHLVSRFRGNASAQQALDKVWSYWRHTLGAVQIETPDRAVNFLTNGWLVYQTLCCRMWARTGFYQSGGAFGFRDQLQDAMALVHAEPSLFREHLLRAAAHQFREGDVQHWWHPPIGRGVRTHFSDDYLFLAAAVCRYVSTVGDTGVLDENVPFLQGRAVRPDEDAYYDLPQPSSDVGTLYEHCVRAVNHGLRFGVHGLPLMGCGDWNDGMNLVGEHGKGESVWLAFFLCDILDDFITLAAKRGDTLLVDRYTIEVVRLRANIELHGWDGQWYLRAYFDDGTPLGSSTNQDCQIDAIAQSWSVLSGAAPRERSVMAMENVARRLVRPEEQLIQLLDPPFDKSSLNPGYIKGYVPGVRENGGQYTHAAIWTAMAFAELGDTARAWQLLSMINPILHATDPVSVEKYRVEPFVVAADVYAVPPHTGRGGWTWYTGSAGWLYRLITESLLGLHLEIDQLRLNPRLPADWKSCKLHYRYRATTYHIQINQGSTADRAHRLSLDGQPHAELVIPLVDDRKDHQVEVYI